MRKIAKMFLSIIFFLSYTLSAQSQVHSIEGKVVDVKGEPLIGVSILEVGTLNGTVTDIDGYYKLTFTSSDATLKFTYIGFEDFEIKVENRSNLDVILKDATSVLDEVVVVGYGTMRRSDLTGAIKSISMDDMPLTSVTNLTQSLRGFAAGLNVAGGSGAGSLPSMSIRGQNTLSASTAPLVVLDGIIFNGSIADINPADVERIDVLKDASSAAIYGSRSANGVIHITTKKGRDSKPVVSFDTSFGLQDYTNNPVKWMNAEQYANRLVDYNYFQKLYTWYKKKPTSPSDRGGKPAHPGYGEDIVLGFLKSEDEKNNYLAGNDIDWINEVTRVAPTSNYNLNISGGSEKHNYFASVSHTDQKGVLKGDEFERTTINLKVEGDITDWIKVGLNTTTTYRDYSGISADMYAAQNSSPLASKYDENGRYPTRFNDEMLMTHPLRYEYTDDSDKRKNIFMTGYAKVKVPFIKNLVYDFNYSNNFNSTNHRNFYPSSTDEGLSKQGLANIDHSESTYWIFNHILRYVETFNDIHKFDVTLLYTQDKLFGNSSAIDANRFSNEFLGYNNVGFAEQYSIGSGAYEQSSLGYMARLNYSLMNRYLFTGTYRRDGFSGFGENSKLANFYSASFAWNISEEKFMSDLRGWMDYMKLRVSYGQNGNQGVGRYSSLSRMVTQNYVFESSPYIGLAPSTLGNESLGWEVTNSTNFGIDFSILDQRISGNIDFYDASTNDVLVKRNLPGTTGYANVWTNIGQIKNKGIEVEVNTVNIKKPLTWESRFVFSLNRDKIADLYGDGKDDIGNQWFIGEPISAVYDYERSGDVWTEEDLYNGQILTGFYPGQFKLTDINEDTKITAAEDRKIVGYTTPNYRFGIGNTLSYKNFSLYFFINSIQGGNGYYIGDLKRLLEATSEYDYAQRANQPAIRENWTPDNGVTDTPAIYNYPTVASGNYQDRSFIRLQDLSFSYSFDKKMTKALNIENLQIYLSGHNLYTWTNWEGFDPELGGFYEMMIRDMNIGLKMSF